MEIIDVQFKHILYATDFSESSKYACSYAKSIAEKYDAEITLLHVIKDELTDMLIFDAGNEPTPDGVTKRLQLQKDYYLEQKQAILSNIRDEYGAKGVGIDNIIVEIGIPSRVIVKVAEDMACDLIVMGVKGRGYGEDMLMGDKARRVITRTKVPVLVVQ